MKTSLVVAIVRKGWGSTVLKAAVDAGARGGTVVVGRGVGMNEQEKIFGLAIEPEKEVLLTVVPDELVDGILEAVGKAGELSEVGRGLAFVLPVTRVVGVQDSLARRPGSAGAAP